MTEILVRVIVGRCDHRSYNAYFETSLTESDMTLAKDTNVNVRVQCSALGYDSGALGVDGDLPASYHDIADLNNDPVVYDDEDDLSTIRGDSVRYFLITGASPGQTYSVDISTDAVSGNTGGRLQTLTLTAQTLPRQELRGGGLSCFKHTYFDDGESLGLANGGSLAAVWHGWDQGSGQAKHTYGTPRTWTVSSVDASGNVEYSGTGDPSNGDLVSLANSTIEEEFVFVSAIDTSSNTFVALDHTGAAVDLSGLTITSMVSVGDEPPAGMSGLHFERIGDQNPHFYAMLDDSVYTSRLQANNHLPIINTSQSRGAWTRRIVGDSTPTESATVNRDTGTPETLAFAQNARFFFIQPEVIEAGQQAPLVFIRGDWDLTPGNDFSHLPLGPNSQDWSTFSGTPTDLSNPMLDANYTARMTNTVTQWANGTDVWNCYFAGGNPVSFVEDQADTDYPPILTKDSSGNITIDPVVTYGANKRHYKNRGFVIENERHCIICPDSMSHRGARFNAGWDAHPFWSQAYPTPSGVIVGQEHVWGPYQEAQIQLKANSVKDRKTIGLLNKGMILLGSYDISEINPDSAYSSARDESARVSTFFQGIGALMLVGDRHVTPTERADGKGRAEESGFIQQCIAGAQQKSYGANTSDHDLSLGIVNGTNEQLTFQTLLVTGETLHSDTVEAKNVAQATVKFVTAINAANNRSGGGFGGTSQCGGALNTVLRDSDGTERLEINGMTNRKTGPVAQRGAEIICRVGVGGVTADDSSNNGDELPSGFSVTLEGYTFLPANVTQTTTVDLDGTDSHKIFTIGGDTDFFGGSSTGLDPTITAWGSGQSIGIGDRRLSPDPDVELESLGVGTTGATPPPIDGNLSSTNTVADSGGFNWQQVFPTDVLSASISWTDNSVSAGGGTTLEGVVDPNALLDDSSLLRTA